MIKKIEILGLQIDNYNVRESMMLVEKYLNNDVMNIIETITMKQIAVASESELEKDGMDLLDLAIVGEKEILKAAGIKSTQRIREIEENDFFKEFLKRIVRNKKTVFLLGAEEEELEIFQEFLQEHFEKLKIAGSSFIEDIEQADAVINEINIASPDIIFSLLITPEWERFLLEHRNKLNAKIWYGVGRDYQRNGNGKFGRIFQNLSLKLRLKIYKNEKEEE